MEGEFISYFTLDHVTCACVIWDALVKYGKLDWHKIEEF